MIAYYIIFILFKNWRNKKKRCPEKLEINCVIYFRVNHYYNSILLPINFISEDKNIYQHTNYLSETIIIQILNFTVFN